MIEAIQFMWTAWKSYRGALRAGSYYAAVTNAGVPTVCVFCAVGRDAWRVSQRAFEEFELK